MPTESPPPSHQVWMHCERHQDLVVAFIGQVARTPGTDLKDHLSPAPDEISWLRQVHSARVRSARAGLAGDGDALVTDEPGMALAVATADCVPVLLSDGRRVAAIHAGWRGLVAGVIEATMERLEPATGDTRAWIGPAIGADCYEIGEDVAAQLLRVGSERALSQGPTGRPHADLSQIAQIQLERCRVQEIHRLDLCTRCESSRLASYRRDGAKKARNWAVIWKPIVAPGLRS